MTTKITRRTLLKMAGVTAASAVSVPDWAMQPSSVPSEAPQRTQVAERVALALSGGGTKGDFQIGALRYLYDKQQIDPEIICGTSIGAINSVKLSEGKDAIADLEGIWRSLDHSRDVYDQEPWLQGEREELRAKLDSIPEGEYELQFGSVVGSMDVGGVTQVFKNQYIGALLTNILEDRYKNEIAVFNLNPVRALLSSALNSEKRQEWFDKGGKLRLATVAATAGKLRYYAGETGILYERDNQTPVAYYDVDLNAGKCNSFEAEVRGIQKEIKDLQDELETAPNRAFVTSQIRKLLPELAAAKGRLASCRSQYPPLWEKRPVRINLIDGVIASAAIPVIFHPVEMLGDVYVDGGVMEITPIQAALDLGATKIYAIQCSPAEPPTWSSTPQWSDEAPRLLNLLGRTINLLLVEVDSDDLRRLDTRIIVDDCTSIDREIILIRPTIALHSTQTVNPGLIDIQFDYGYMRAADIITGNIAENQLVDEIIRSRYEAWHREVELAQRGNADAELRSLKQKVQSLAVQRKGVMPPNFEKWWQSYERHPRYFADTLASHPFPG